MDQKVIQQGSGGYYQDYFGIGATIRIGQKMLCLQYADFGWRKITKPLKKKNFFLVKRLHDFSPKKLVKYREFDRHFCKSCSRWADLPLPDISLYIVYHIF